jgi:hypothetical protein
MERKLLTYSKGEGSFLAAVWGCILGCVCENVCLVSDGFRFGAPGAQNWASSHHRLKLTN